MPRPHLPGRRIWISFRSRLYVSAKCWPGPHRVTAGRVETSSTMPKNERRQWIAERTAVLEGSASPQELEVAATSLAWSDDPEALDALGGFLRRAEFLDRLD